jgi:hypothetical protein
MLPEIPRLGNQLDLRKRSAGMRKKQKKKKKTATKTRLRNDGVLVNDVEESAQLVHVVEGAGEGGGEIEAEAIDVHLLDPVSQA